MRTHRFRYVIVPLVTLGILAGIIYYLHVNTGKYLSFLQISAKGVFELLVLSLTVPIVNGLINVYLFRCLDANLSHREGIYLAASATLANQLPIPGGIIARGVYLKHRHGLAYSQYISATLALFFCTISADGLIGVAILLYWIVFKHTVAPPFLLASFALMTASFLVFVLPLSRLKLPGKIGDWLGQALQGWVLISRNRTLLTRLIGLQVGFMLLFAGRQWIAFRMLSQDISIGQAVLLSCGSVLTQLVSFAPGGLGVREAIVGTIASALGFDLTVSIAAVELDRLISGVVILLVGGGSSIILGKQMAVDT